MYNFVPVNNPGKKTTKWHKKYENINIKPADIIVDHWGAA